ncbi:unnamed protein product [Calypogeia fissa]
MALTTKTHSFFGSVFFAILKICIAYLGFQVAKVSAATTLTASLDYGTFQGAYSSTYNITYWTKIPFAAPPLDENRFRAPQPPTPIPNGVVYNSTQGFDSCPQGSHGGTEDCLYLGLYSRPWSSPQPLRPVVVNFYGGGFIQGGGSFTLPPPGFPVLNVSSTNDFIFVSPNYRVNAFGFLPGKEIASDPNSDTNVGLLDQQAALQWTQKYIELFGGDPESVAIWGQSAGAGSVVAHVIASGGKASPPLFTKALASSPYWPKTYRFDAPEAQSVYDAFARLAGCNVGAMVSGVLFNSLACLKAADLQTLRTAALYISGSHKYTSSSFTWAPVIGDSFLPQSLSQASLNGDVNVDFAFGMYNAFEGESFLPPELNDLSSSANKNKNNISSTRKQGVAHKARSGHQQQNKPPKHRKGMMMIPPLNSSTMQPSLFETWLRGFLPGFSDMDIQLVEEMYPANGTIEVTGSYDTDYLRAQFIYRDLILACPALWLSSGAQRAGYMGQYAIPPAVHSSGREFYYAVTSSMFKRKRNESGIECDQRD